MSYSDSDIASLISVEDSPMPQIKTSSNEPVATNASDSDIIFWDKDVTGAWTAYPELNSKIRSKLDFTVTKSLESNVAQRRPRLFGPIMTVGISMSTYPSAQTITASQIITPSI
jgi:hypothetical protein